MWNWHDGGWGWGGWFMPLMMVIFTVAVIVAIVFVVRAFSAKSPSEQQATRQQPPPLPAAHVETPKQVVERRYAAGEIDREEYLQKIKDLGP